MIGIIEQLDHARKIMTHPETSHAEALAAAGEALVAAGKAIAELNSRRFTEPLDNPLLRGTGYRTELDEDAKLMRFSIFHGAAQNILAWMTFPVEEIYVLSSKCLRAYDKLEGIK